MNIKPIYNPEWETYLPLRKAQIPIYDIKHAGNIPGVCEDCNTPPVEFLVYANQHFSFVRFYCHEHYLKAVYEKHPSGFPSEPM